MEKDTNLKELKSPKENIAQKVVMSVMSATTEVKEIIVNGLTTRLSQDEIAEKLNKVIAKYCGEIKDLSLRETTRNALIISARKWYYQLDQTIRILSRNAITQANLSEGVYNIALARSDFLTFNELRPLLSKDRKGLAIIEDYRSKLRVAISALATEPPKVVEVAESANRKGYVYTMPLRNRAEMAVRYEANMTDLQNLIDAGVEYVWTSSHADASPRCSPHQGKLYSLNPKNKRGVINGIRYEYLPDILKLNKGNSIINGYNCRHRLVEYKIGSSPPEHYTKQEIKREYYLDQRQRYYENNIRHLKTEERLLRQMGELDEAQKVRLKWRRMSKGYEIMSLKAGRAYYSWRTMVSNEEITTNL